MNTGKAVNIVLIIVALSVIGYTLLHEDDRAAAPNFANKSDQAVEVRADDPVSVRTDDVPLLQELPEELESELGTTITQLVYEIDDADLVDQQLAWDAGHAELSSIDPQRILRWRPIRMDPTIFVATESYGGIESLETLVLPFFPDREIVAKRSRFRSNPDASMYSWSGTVESESGEIGNVVIHIARDQDSGDLKVTANYNDRLRDLHIIPTDDSPYYVAMETYRGYVSKVD